jgi:hypothetical protein
MKRSLSVCLGAVVAFSFAAAQDASAASGAKTAPTALAAADAAAIHRASPGLVEANGFSAAARVIALPAMHGISAGESVSAGTIVYTDRQAGADAAIQSLADGSARAYVIVNQPNAPTHFRFNFNLPAGARFVQTPTTAGEAISLIGSTGSVLGTIMPAWARAADGSMVPTSYTIDGSSIVQTVLHLGARYPVVADPWLSFGCCTWHGGYMVLHLSWNETIGLLYGGWAAIFVTSDFICSRVPWPFSMLCGAGEGAIAGGIWDGVNYVVSHGWGCGTAVEYDLSGFVTAWYECPW